MTADAGTTNHQATTPVVELPPLPDGTKNENPSGISFFTLLREDYATHDRRLSEPGLWAVWTHRLGNWRMDIRPKLLRAPFSLLYKMMYLWVLWVWGIQLDYSIPVGRRLRIWHHGGMFLVARSIGNDVHIRQNTTFGVKNRTELLSKPIIEDRVEIGCGVTIVGDVRVGHDSIIAANTLVTRDVPPHALVLGVPGKVVKQLDTPPAGDTHSEAGNVTG